MDDLTIYKELYEIVSHGDLSNKLDARLQSLPNVDQILQHFYEQDGLYINLLILAALHGHDAITHVILSHSLDVERLVKLSGNIIDIDGKPLRHVTALWCACDRGHYTVARTLIETGGASVDFGTGNPLLIDAVIRERFDTIQFLIENNYADINRTRERSVSRYNSLMVSAARGQFKIVAYLLEKGAKVNYTTSTNKTALGCAVAQGHLDIAQLLCCAGASIDMNNPTEEAALILAFRNGHFHVFDYLLTLTKSELCIEELELTACSVIVTTRRTNHPRSQLEKMANLMRKIFHLRSIRNSPKIVAEPVSAYGFHQECQTIEEFEQIQHDDNRLYIEALLIRERILLPRKTNTLCQPLITYGEKLIGQGDFEQCLHLWEHTFHLYQKIGQETTLCQFVWIFCKMLTNNVFISSEQFLKVCQLTLEPTQQFKENHSIKNTLCLLTIAVKVLEQPQLTKIERQSIYQWIIELCRQHRTTSDGQTFLHLCVNDQTHRDINHRPSDIKPVLNFPNFAVTQLLLTLGSQWIDLDAVNTSNGDTVLHIICQSTKTDTLPIVNLLINAGAHTDCLNKHNKTPMDYASTAEIKALLQKQQVPSLLKCLCARYIVTQNLNYELIWPEETKLNHFIFLHGVLGKQKPIA